MAEYMIQGETLTAIAEAIRAKLESSAEILPSEMAALIGSIETGVKMVSGAVSISNKKTSYALNHGLGVTPNFVVLYRTAGGLSNTASGESIIVNAVLVESTVSGCLKTNGYTKLYDLTAYEITANESSVTFKNTTQSYYIGGDYRYVIAAL